MRLLNGSYLLVGVALCLGVTACGSEPLGENSDSATSQTKFDLVTRQNRIRQFVADRRAKLNIVATTTTDTGAMIDWVPRNERAPRPAPPQELPPPLKPGQVYATTELETQPWNKGPEGTVPVMRFDVENYLSAMGDRIPDDPELGLMPKPSPNNSRFHAVWYSTGANYRGMAGYVNIWDAPQLETGDTNIGQIFAGRGNDTVEAGKIEYKGLNGGAASFFVYFTTNYYASSGNFIGGYPWEGYAGWQQWSSTVFPGAKYNYLSKDGGQQVVGDYRLWHFGPNDPGYRTGETYEYQQGWWVSTMIGSNIEWVGYWPSCYDANNLGVACSSPNVVGRTFAAGGLNSYANDVEIYGEVYDHNDPHATTTDMGSGKPASADYLHAAYMEWVRVLPNVAGTQDWVLFQNAAGTRNTWVTDSACYSMTTPYLDTADNWFFYGGNGKGQSGCTY